MNRSVVWTVLLSIGLWLMSASAWSAPPPLSPDAGDVIINEIQQTTSNNGIEFVELYFAETQDITGWTLETNGSGNSADSSCPLPDGLYASGTFLIVDGTTCVDWHPEQREIYILDDNGELVHYISLWHNAGNQDGQGAFGNPDDFPSEYDTVTTDLNELPSDFGNYCAEIDGSTPTGDWNTDGQSCPSTEGESNNGTIAGGAACTFDPELMASYFNNFNATPPPALERFDANIDFDWGWGSPDTSVNNNFSARWTGYLRAPVSGEYRFRTISYGGIRFTLSDTQLIDEWTDVWWQEQTHTISINLSAGQLYPIEVDFLDSTWVASMELRWQLPGSSSWETVPASDLFHCNDSLPVPALEWRMDQSNWMGTSGEVSDSSGNNRDGTAQNQTDTELAHICRGGVFDGTDDYLTHTDIDNLLSGTASMSFWIKTTQTGSDVTWQAPGISGVEVVGSANDIFWGWIDASGHIGLSVGDDGTTKSTQAINDDTFHHVVLTRDAGAGTFKIYIDGVLDSSGSIATGTIGNTFASIGRIEDTGGTPEYFEGVLDELVIFDQVLSDAEVALIHTYQSNDQNLDGSDRDLSNCDAAQLCYSTDFNSALGSDWQTLNSSGSFGDPRVVGGRLRLTDDTFNVATAATLLRQFPSAGNRVEVEFDYYAYKDNGATNAADGVTITFSDRNVTPYPGSFGGSLGYAQRDNGDPGFSGGWLGIGLDEYGNYSNNNEGRVGGPGFRPNAVAIRGSGSGTTGYRYLDGTAANLSPTVLTDSANPHRYRIVIDHSDGSQAMTSVERDTGSGFQTLINPFNVLAGGLGQDAIPDRLVLTLTGSTGGSTANHEIDNLDVYCNTVEPYDVQIDHFELVRGQDTGLTCEPMDIAIRACANADCSIEYSGTFDITMSPATGWVGGPSFTGLESGDTVQFLGTDPNTPYTLGVDNSTPSSAPLTQDACYVGASSTPEADCDVTFDNIGLLFFPSENTTASTAYFDLVAGADETGFSVQAVETNTTTGICEPLFADGVTLDFEGGTSCSDPLTCSTGPQVSLISDGTTTVLPNPQNPIGGEDLVTVPLTFGPQSTATFALNAPDVGVQPLELTYSLPDADGNPSDTTISQTVNLRVQSAELRLLNIQGSNGTMDATQTVSELRNSTDHFARAGETFTLEVQSLNDQGDPTPNFGRTANLPTLTWDHSLVSPTGTGSTSGNVTATSDSTQWEAGTPTSRIRFVTGAGLAFSEVGVIQLQGRIDDYLPISGSPELAVSSDTRLVGRFTPAYFTTEYVSGTGTVQNAQSGFSYQGQTLDWASPLQVRLTAYNADDDVTNNYDSGYWAYSPEGEVPRSTAPLFGLGKASGTQGGDLTITPADPVVIDDGSPFNGIRFLQLGANTFSFERAILPVDLDESDNPFIFQLDASLSAEYLTDDDSVCFDNDQDGTCDALTINDINTQANLYYGRARLESAQGPETSDLELPLVIEYWDTVQDGFVPMTDEDAGTDTNLVPNDFSIGASSPVSLAAETGVGGIEYTGGVGVLTLDAPGEGNTGEVDVNGQNVLINQSIPEHLWFDWNEDGTATPTSAKGYFGVYQGREPILYQLDGFR